MNKKLKYQTKVLVAIILVLTAVLLVLVITGSFFFLRFDMWKAWKNRGTRFYTPSQITQIKEDSYSGGEDAMVASIRAKLEGGTGINAILRAMYPDSYIYTVNGRYYFTPINFDLRLNTLNNDCFVQDEETGEITYDDGTIVGHKGIDVSKYQGTINWSKVAASGVEYAIIRCGYRGYESGVITADSNFDTYAKGATSNGIAIGAYFYTQAITTEEAAEEADYVVSCLSAYDATYPICLDVEDSDDNARQSALSNEELTNIVIAFCERVKALGYTPMIYANNRYFAGRLNMDELDEYDKWYAMYADTPYIPYEIAMWQYSSSGQIDGINASVDLNISFKTWE